MPVLDCGGFRSHEAGSADSGNAGTNSSRPRLQAPCRRPSGVRIVYGTGTVIARQARAHLAHDGPFEACRRRNAFQWAPDQERGVLVTAEDGRLVEESALTRRLLLP